MYFKMSGQRNSREPTGGAVWIPVGMEKGTVLLLNLFLYRNPKRNGNKKVTTRVHAK